MPPINYDTLTFDEIADAYNENSSSFEELKNIISKNENTVKEILGADCGNYLSNLNRINTMHERRCPYLVLVLAKQHILREEGKPFSPASLMGFENDTPEMKARIKDYLLQHVNDQATLESFNTGFFKSEADFLIGKLKPVMTGMENLSEAEKREKMLPYYSLVNGLWDTYVQKFDQPSYRAGSAAEENAVSHAAIDYMYEWFNREFLIRSDQSGLIRHKVGQKDRFDMESVKKVLFNACTRNSVYHECMQNLKELPDDNAGTREEIPAGERMPASVKKSSMIIMPEFANWNSYFSMNQMSLLNTEQVEGRGLLARLSEGELTILLTDPALRERFTVRELVRGKNPATGEESKSLFPEKLELGFGTIDLQIHTPSSQVNSSRLKDLKNSIHAAYRSHMMEKNAGTKNITSLDALRENAANLKEAEEILKDTTHWYNSSPNYRAMQDKLEIFREKADLLTALTAAPTDDDLTAYRDAMKDAKEAVKTYLRGKNALGDRSQFKNTYEANRVAAARSMLRALNTKEESLNKAVLERNRTAQQIKYAEKFEKLYKFIHAACPKFELDDEQKKACYSLERIALHEKAKQAFENKTKLSNLTRGKNIPASFKRLSSAFLQPGSSMGEKQHNDKVIKSMSGGDLKSKMDNQKRFVELLNRFGKLDRSKLDIHKHSLSEIEKHAIENYVIESAAFTVYQCMQDAEHENDLNLKMKEGTKGKIKNLKNHCEAIGNASKAVTENLEDDLLFMVPFDQMISMGITSEDLKEMEHKISLEFSKMSPEDKKLFGSYGKIRTEYETISKIDEIEEQAPDNFTLDDFTGVVTPEMAAKEAQEKQKRTEKEAGDRQDRLFEEKKQQLEKEAGNRKNAYHYVISEAIEARKRIFENFRKGALYEDHAEFEKDVRSLMLAQHVMHVVHLQPKLPEKKNDVSLLRRLNECADEDNLEAQYGAERDQLKLGRSFEILMNKLKPVKNEKGEITNRETILRAMQNLSLKDDDCTIYERCAEEQRTLEEKTDQNEIRNRIML